jgi:multiple sugar transport system ATP-binding protein
MNEGHIQQIGTPLELYDRPANQFVAGFIGSPAMNMMHGVVRNGLFVASDGDLHVDGVGTLPQGKEIVLGIRPEDIYNADGPYVPSAVSVIPARVDVVEPMGNEIYLYATVGDREVVARLAPQAVPQPDAHMRLALDVEKLHFFDAGTGDRIL